MEIFVEGTRSRSGKPYMAMTGLLSIVVDSLCENIVTDVMIIPVGISYDRIIEGNYNSEQLVGTIFNIDAVFILGTCSVAFSELWLFCYPVQSLEIQVSVIQFSYYSFMGYIGIDLNYSIC